MGWWPIGNRPGQAGDGSSGAPGPIAPDGSAVAMYAALPAMPR
jgi:hypothetical protein